MCRQTGHHQRCSGSDIGSHDFGTPKFSDAIYYGFAAGDCNICSQSAKFHSVQISIFKNSLYYMRSSRSYRRRSHCAGLQVGGKARIGKSRQRSRFQSFGGGYIYFVLGELNFTAHFHQFMVYHSQLIRVAAGYLQFAAGGGRGIHIGSGYKTVAGYFIFNSF